MEIVRAQAEDAQAAAQVWAESSHLTGGEASKQRLEKVARMNERLFAGGAAWKAMEAGKMVGFAVLIPKEKGYKLSALYVLPAYQGKGLGRQLLDTALEFTGTNTVYLNVLVDNQEATKLYEQRGFVVEKNVSAAKHRNGEFKDRVRMVRNPE